MLAFRMQPMALGSISDSLSCKCHSPLQRLKEPLSVLKTAFAPAMVVAHEAVQHTNTAVPASVLCLKHTAGKAVYLQKMT